MKTQKTFAAAALVAAALFVLGCGSGVSGPQPVTGESAQALSLLPPEARVVGMVNFKELAANESTAPFSSGPFSAELMDGEAEARLRDFLDVTGFEPEDDLERLYLTVSHDTPESALVVAYASYEPERVAQFIRDRGGAGLDETAYREVPVFVMTEDENTMAVALTGGSMVLASGSVDAVRAAVDRMLDGGTSLANNDEVMPLVGRVAGLSSWIVATRLDEAQGEHSPDFDSDFANLGEAVRNAALGFGVSSTGVTGSAFLAPGAGVSARDLADLTRGAIAALKAAPDRGGPELREALDDVSVVTTGELVRIDFRAGNAVLQKLAADM